MESLKKLLISKRRRTKFPGSIESLRTSWGLPLGAQGGFFAEIPEFSGPAKSSKEPVDTENTGE
jgi:hypothetical protein